MFSKVFVIIPPLQAFLLQSESQYYFHLQLIIDLSHFKSWEELIQSIIYLKTYEIF